MNVAQHEPNERPSPCSSHSNDESDDYMQDLYPDDLLNRMFSTETLVSSNVDSACVNDVATDFFPTTLLGRMFESSNVDAVDSSSINRQSDCSERAHDTHMFARMFDTSAFVRNDEVRHDEVRHDDVRHDDVRHDDVRHDERPETFRHDSATPNVQSAIPTMSILETNEQALSALPLSSRMFESSTMEERNIISQYEFQSTIREIVSVRHSIRDHVIQLRHLRTLHRKYEERLHEMLQQVNQDGVRSCDYPLLFYMSRRTKRRVNKQVHQSEQLQTFMKSRGIHMSDVERKDLISLIKKESVIKRTEGMIRSVPIDSR